MLSLLKIRNLNIALGLLLGISPVAALEGPFVFHGTCDASAAVQLDNDVFAVASDEDNLLRLYRLSRPGGPVATLDLHRFLFDSNKKALECDLEAVARIGNRTYWISSHGQNSAGVSAPNRHRFFALDIRGEGESVTLAPVGRVYTNLITELIQDRRFARFELGNAAARAPKSPGGLNIEALTDTPEGGLLIGFRNPVPGGRALVVPLTNPAEVVFGAGPEFGEPVLLDLDGLGLRGMGSTKKGYYLLAGPVSTGSECQLYYWQGGHSLPRKERDFDLLGINAEAICFHDQGHSSYVILSDDGARKTGRTKAKRPAPESGQFRAFKIAADSHF